MQFYYFITVIVQPFTQKVLISINFCHFRDLRPVVLQVANLTRFWKYMYVIMKRNHSIAQIKLANFLRKPKVWNFVKMLRSTVQILIALFFSGDQLSKR